MRPGSSVQQAAVWLGREGTSSQFSPAPGSETPVRRRNDADPPNVRLRVSRSERQPAPPGASFQPRATVPRRRLRRCARRATQRRTAPSPPPPDRSHALPRASKRTAALRFGRGRTIRDVHTVSPLYQRRSSTSRACASSPRIHASARPSCSAASGRCHFAARVPEPKPSSASPARRRLHPAIVRPIRRHTLRQSLRLSASRTAGQAGDPTRPTSAHTWPRRIICERVNSWLLQCRCLPGNCSERFSDSLRCVLVRTPCIHEISALHVRPFRQSLSTGTSLCGMPVFSPALVSVLSWRATLPADPR